MTDLEALTRSALEMLQKLHALNPDPQHDDAGAEAIRGLEEVLAKVAKLTPATKKEINEAIDRRENISYKSFASGVEWSERRLGARKPRPTYADRRKPPAPKATETKIQERETDSTGAMAASVLTPALSTATERGYGGQRKKDTK